MSASVVNHIGLCVHDIDRSRRFYEELLGFEYEREIAPPDDPTGRLLQLEPPVGLRAVYLRKDGLLLELLAYDGRRRPRRERPMDEPGLTHLSIGAEDHGRLLDRAEGLGGEVVRDSDIGVAVFIRDRTVSSSSCWRPRGLDVPDSKMLIDGKLVDAEGGATFENLNPATEEVLGVVADGSAADMAAAVAAARRAFDTTEWSTDRALRARSLHQLQAAIEGEREELRHELVAEVGCPVLITYGPQLDTPLREALLWPAQMIDEFPWERPIGRKDAMGVGYETERFVWKEPIGVVGIIVPWNFPVEILLNKLGPVLAMGNTCVVKPAPDTPFNAARIGRLIAEQTEIPPGVVNIVSSSDHLVGEVITTSPDVDMVAFTGSTVTGRRIMEAASATLKPTFLELGGKSVNLLLDDADFEASLPGAVVSCMHGGQGCAIPSRILVPRNRYDEAVDLVRGGFDGWRYGDPTDTSVLQGPQISRKQQDRVLGYIEKGKAEGARLVTGGGVPAHLPKGFFVEPTLFADVDNGMTIAREEIFGPVLVMIPYDDVDDAVRIANDSLYGLSGAITSGDLERAKGVARRIRTGTLGINGGIWYGADAPFGGYKGSGIGRQCGIEGLEIFTETKTVGWPAAAV